MLVAQPRCLLYTLEAQVINPEKQDIIDAIDHGLNEWARNVFTQGGPAISIEKNTDGVLIVAPFYRFSVKVGERDII